MQRPTPTDDVDDTDYEQQEIAEFVQMLQRRISSTNKMQMSLSELDKAFAYAAIPGPGQDHLRVVVSAARRAGWVPPDDR